jgi:hypothetical protein
VSRKLVFGDEEPAGSPEQVPKSTLEAAKVAAYQVVSATAKTYHQNLISKLLFDPEKTDEIEERLQAISEPLETLDSGVGVEDLKEDVKSFSIVAALSQHDEHFHEAMPALVVGASFVPLLPDGKELLVLLRRFLVGETDTAFRSYVAGSYLSAILPEDSKTQFVDRERAEQHFFSGLTHFLSRRIFGSGEPPPPPPPSKGLNWDGPSPPSIFGSGQWWNVETKTHGLAIYCCGTHAARRTPTYLNAKTSPLGIFLRFGTWHLATKVSGLFVWDESIVEAPSLTPSYTADW